ncbi:MAG: sugar phosphate nucleotidyltransferase [Chlamydia sp.]
MPSTSTAEDNVQKVKELRSTVQAKQPRHASKKPALSKVACVVLAGGQGTRLFPLTKFRCKPAIVFGGRYKLVDIPISNAIHCGISKIFVVTQFLARSLHRHIFHTYKKDSLNEGFVEVLSAEQRPDSSEWYRGTADAVRQNLEYLLETDSEYFLILSGDQLYRLDFVDMLETLISKDVDALVATLAVSSKEATRLGIMKINEDHHIVDFSEKPSSNKLLERLITPASILSKMGLNHAPEKQFLASMGIYLFKRSALEELLSNDPRDDFGKHLIPNQVHKGRIGAYIHSGYWEDIGTIESFYTANMALTTKNPEFDCYSDELPIFAQHDHLPGPRFSNTTIRSSTICEGAIINAEEIANSIIGHRSVIGEGSSIQDSYLMGNDTYTPSKRSQMPNFFGLSESNQSQMAPFAIGRGCTLKKTIIDRNVRIGDRVQLINKKGLTNFDSDIVYIRDGIIVVPQGAEIPDGFVL